MSREQQISEYWGCPECGERNLREDGPICDNCEYDGRNEDLGDYEEPMDDVDRAYLRARANGWAD